MPPKVENTKKRKKPSESGSGGGRRGQSKDVKGKGPTKDFRKDFGGGEGTGGRSNKKRALKQERQSHRRHYEEVTKAKALWEKLRMKSTDEEERVEIMVELMDLLKGCLKDVTMKHDGARVVQAMIQFGNEEQRSVLVKELSPSLSELCKAQYAHHTVVKVVTYCCGASHLSGGSKKLTPAEKVNQRLVISGLKGQIPRLAVHPMGSRIVDAVFSNLPAKLTSPLRQELYGPHFALFLTTDVDDVVDTKTKDGKKGTPPGKTDLQSILARHPDKRDVTLNYVKGIVTKGIDKTLFSYSYFHHLFADYVSCARPSDVRDIAPKVVDHSIHLLSTRHGTHAVCACASYGTPKDRKRILKSIKGYTHRSLLHRDAYLAILRLVDVTDDTVTVHKMILSELTDGSVKADSGVVDDDDDDEGGAPSPLLDLALSESGSKLFLLLLAGKDGDAAAYFDPHEREILGPAEIKGDDGSVVPTSKKDPKVRREELLHSLRDGLVDLARRHPTELMTSWQGMKVLQEVYHSFPSEELALSFVDAAEESCCLQEEEDEDDDGLEQSLFEDPVAHLFLKNMLLSEGSKEGQKQMASRKSKRNYLRQSSGEPAKDAGDTSGENRFFSDALYDRFKGRLFKLIASSNRGAFVLAALAYVEHLRPNVQNELECHVKDIEREAAERMGFEALAKAMQPRT